jgi:hypothetical protein
MSDWVSGEEEGVGREPKSAEEKFGKELFENLQARQGSESQKQLLMEKGLDKSWGVGL